MNKFFLTLFLPWGLLTACATTPPPLKVTLDTNAMQFQPASFEVVAGQPVELTFSNQDVLDHDFTIMEIPITRMTADSEPVMGHEMGDMESEPELHMAVMMGKSGTLNFTPTKPGTYEFFCTVAGHKEAGMVGSLVVKTP